MHAWDERALDLADCGTSDGPSSPGDSAGSTSATSDRAFNVLVSFPDAETRIATRLAGPDEAIAWQMIDRSERRPGKSNRVLHSLRFGVDSSRLRLWRMEEWWWNGDGFGFVCVDDWCETQKIVKS